MNTSGWRHFTPQLEEANRLALAGEQVDVQKTEVMLAFRRVARHLGLKPANLVLMEVLAAFTQPIDWSAGSRPIVWTSNEKLMDLTGFSRSALKRHLRRLMEVGLVTFRDSANGKRYGRRDAKGRIVEAFGFDLSPLAARLEEFKALYEKLARDAGMLKAIRRQITALRRNIRARIEWLAGSNAGLAARLGRCLSRLLGMYARRALNLAVLCRLRDRLLMVERIANLQIREQATAPDGWEPAKEDEFAGTVQPDTGLPEAGLPEPALSGAGGPQKHQGTTVDLAVITRACPGFVDYAKATCGTVTSWGELVRAADTIRPIMGVSESLWERSKADLGRTRAAAALALVTDKYHLGEIGSPGGYLRGMLGKDARGELHLERSFYGRLNARSARPPAPG